VIARQQIDGICYRVTRIRCICIGHAAPPSEFNEAFKADGVSAANASWFHDIMAIGLYMHVISSKTHIACFAAGCASLLNHHRARDLVRTNSVHQLFSQSHFGTAGL
jgi:hypothetical protein